MEAKATPPPASVRLPDGVADHPPARARALKHRLRTIVRALELSGYDRVYTPTFELVDVLEPGLGEAARRALFRMVDPASGEIVVLRPDFTAQVARMVAARLGEMQRPLRLYYEGRVARARDPLGRDLSSRDLFQAGVELIGAGDDWADVEVLALALEVFEGLAQPLTITVGHAAFVDLLLGADRDGPAVRAALSAKDAATVRTLAPEVLPLLDLYGDRDVLAEARRVLAKAPPAIAGALDRLDRVAAAVEALGGGAHLVFDLGEQRSLGYYPGLFFHGYLEGAPDAVLSGGRYDELLGRFGRAEPAVGFAIDVGAIPDPIATDHAPHGVVIATDDPLAPAVQRELSRRRQIGERAVTAPAEVARDYAKAHDFADVVRVVPDGSSLA